MIPRALGQVRYPVETVLLVAVCLFLPLQEFWKNASWLAYVVCWFVNRAKARDFGGPWDAWDSLAAAWLASGFVVAAFAGLPGGGEWHAALDIVRYGSLFWLARRARYGERELHWLLGALVASTVIGLVVGYARIWTGLGKSGTLQLYSVGHVNHTAIYLAIMLGVCASWLFARWRGWRPGRRAVGLAVTAFVLASLVVTASRAAIVPGLALLLLLAVLWWPRWRAPLAASLAAVALTIAAAFSLEFEAVRKYDDNVAEQNVFSHRDGIWRMGMVAWERFPLFGVGMGNYKHITLERVREWRTAAGKDFVAERYVHFPHGHSLYVNALAERGVIGAGVLFVVLLAWLAALTRLRPRAQDGDLDWTLYGAAVGAWGTTVAAGVLNTTLHHEHAILAALLLGLWLSRQKRTRAS